jgi:hypothetical protein
MMNDIDVIIRALSKEREDLHQQLMQLDRIINKVKTGNYEGQIETPEPIKLDAPKVPAITPKVFADSGNIKVQVLRIFDVIGVACKLRDVQTEYAKLTGLKSMMYCLINTNQRDLTYYTLRIILFLNNLS